MEWLVRNDHPNAVGVRFFSRDRDVVWPDNGELYLLDDSAIKTIPIHCETGETVCFGAWVRGRPDAYWGVGRDGKHGCETCCYACDDGRTPVRVFSE